LVFVNILSSVDRGADYGAGFTGKLVQPGGWISREDFPDPLVALECAGPQGEWRRGRQRDTLWILWRYDHEFGRWMEICRAQSSGWDWATAIRQPAWRALHPDAGLYDTIERTKALSSDIMGEITRLLKDETDDMRLTVLSKVHELVAGAIVVSGK
jgi:hypothetical protein